MGSTANPTAALRPRGYQEALDILLILAQSTECADSAPGAIDALDACGDIPDRDAFSTILASAERALIFCRVPAASPTDVVRKLIHLAPEAEQSELRERLAGTLCGIVYRDHRSPSESDCRSGGAGGNIIETQVLGFGPAIRETILDPEQTRFLIERAKSVGSFERTVSAVEDSFGTDPSPDFVR